MAKCVVLGADGFIGGHLVEALSAAGHDIVAFDRFRDHRQRSLPENLPRVTIMPGDFLNRHDLEAAITGQEYVFHLVSTTNPATSGQDPLVDIETNIKMSVELMRLCVEHGVKRLIFPSTGGAIYGSGKEGALVETDLTEPISPYGIGKLAIEGYLRFFKHAHSLDYLTLRIANPYGERQNLFGSQGAIPIFLNLILQNKPITIYGDGSMVRDYLYVKDLVDIMVQLFDQPTKYSLYNVGSGKGVSLIDLIDAMKQVCGRPVTVHHEPSRPTDVQSVLLDTSRLKREFEAAAHTLLHDGLAITWKYVQAAADRSEG